MDWYAIAVIFFITGFGLCGILIKTTLEIVRSEEWEDDETA